MWKVVLAVEAAGLPVWTSLELAFVVTVLNRSLQGFNGRPSGLTSHLFCRCAPLSAFCPSYPWVSRYPAKALDAGNIFQGMRLGRVAL